MPETLASLEEQRQQLYEEMSGLGDFRPGSIAITYRKCGRGNCACAQAGHPGHGPRYLWSTTQQGRSRAQHLRSELEVAQVEQEVERYRRFLELCTELVKVNEQICRLRPAPEVSDESELRRLKKTLRQKYGKRRRPR